MNQNLQKLQDIIIKAVLSIFIEGCESSKEICNCWWHKIYPPDGNKYRPIQLADLLIAFEKNEIGGTLTFNKDGFRLWCVSNRKEFKIPIDLTKSISEQESKTIDDLLALFEGK